MQRKRMLFIAAAALAVCALSALFSAPQAPGTDKETDPRVLRKLDWFQDLKLGLLMHWGPYAQWGSSSRGRSVPRTWAGAAGSTTRLRRIQARLRGAADHLQPGPVRSRAWAQAAKDAGMRYVVFTTKHHDGFCMFDTQQTDYRITGPDVPSPAIRGRTSSGGSSTPSAREGFRIGAYFSKPDWHSPDYWWPYWATPDRNPNYDTGQYPERWARFVDFTHAQIQELMTGYGPVDILWLDGGWVRPPAVRENMRGLYFKRSFRPGHRHARAWRRWRARTARA